MPTTTPNPAELAAQIKRLACDYGNASHEWGDYRGDAGGDLFDKTQQTCRALHAAIDQLRDLASGPSAGAAVVAWLHEDGERSITAKQKAWGIADGGATATAVKPYNVPAYAAPAATPPAEKCETPRACQFDGCRGKCTPPAEKEVREAPAWGGIDATGKLVDCSLSRDDIEHAGLRAVPLGIQGEEHDQ